jgi:hypothetical protein
MNRDEVAGTVLQSGGYVNVQAGTGHKWGIIVAMPLRRCQSLAPSPSAIA